MKREWLAWAAVVVWALLIFATVSLAPFLQHWIAKSLGRETFTHAVLAWVAIGILSAGVAVWRAPKTGWKQLLWLFLAGSGLVAMTLSLREYPQEAIHILEFGVLAGLLFMALRHRIHDPSIYFAAAGATLVFGILDESLQWIVPDRIWDLRDICINAAAGVVVLVAVAKGLEPSIIRPSLQARGIRLTCRIWVGAVLLLLLNLVNTPDRINAYTSYFPTLRFLESNASVMVEYGYLHHDPHAGVFRSRFTPEALRRVDAERAAEAARLLDASEHGRESFREFIRIHSPLTAPFVHEARVRLYRRDQHLKRAKRYRPSDPRYGQHMGIVFHENRIMERHFAQTLKHSRYSLGPRLRAKLEAYALPATQYESSVSRQLITRLDETQVVVLLTSVLLVLVGVDFKYGRA